MENPLVNQIKQYISPDFISSLAVSTNETEASINNAFDVAIPALLLKMHHKGDAYLRPMFSEIQNVFADSVNEFEFKLEKTASYLDDFLGADKQEFVERISAFSNISQTSAHTVLKTAFLGIIDYFKGLDANFDLSTINGVLTNNLTSLKSMIPVGFGSLSAVDSTINQPTAVRMEEREHADAVINNVVDNNEKDQFKTNESPYTDPRNDKSGNMLKYILIPLLLGIVLIFFLYRGCNREVTIEESVVKDTIQNDTSTTVTTTRTTKEIVVNDQVKLNAYSDGIEDQMVAFLNKGEYKTMTEDQLKEVWFNFDDLNFEHNTANVLPESQKQLDNIAQILTAYPEVKVKIGGYTDKTGDEAVNKKVSTDRAMAVKKFLDDKGLGKQVVGAEGYGSEFAVHPADASEELRLTDRKVALSIRN
ncbi:OmpA family protein [Paenimyroides ummariense]|uniref:OmpA family protein n=1 Tax=Paenimyroides ummariense TaxID=913024 RepID=A0A1I4WA41_9FLAO|nr:OmpA family protein [Paenimyroides ummariense]SFN09829.1 OmpA family protein [Paenimyroides ummariense]